MSNEIQKTRKKETKPRKTRRSTEYFITKASLLHNFKYDYSKSVYIKSNIKLIVTCLLHGDFYILPNNHLRLKKGNLNPSGCPQCGKEHVTNRNKSGTLSHNEFIDRANDIHDYRYDYPEQYVGESYKVTIVCPIHGNFKQLPHNHWRGAGCPRCKNSKGSKKISKLLRDNNIPYTTEYSFPDCMGDKSCLKFDFKITDKNILIEYDGEQHFKPVKFNSKMTDNQAIEVFIKAKRYDNIKNQYCLDNNIDLIRIPYNMKLVDIENIIKLIV